MQHEPDCLTVFAARPSIAISWENKMLRFKVLSESQTSPKMQGAFYGLPTSQDSSDGWLIAFSSPWSCTEYVRITVCQV